MQNKSPINRLRMAPARAGFALVSALPLLISASAYAFNFDFKDGEYEGSFDNTVSYGALMRTQGRDWTIATSGRYSGQNNKNDGDNNFNVGSLASSTAKVTSEFELKKGDEYGMFLRGSAFYDERVMKGTWDGAGDPSQLNNGYRQHIDDHKFPKDVRNAVGSKARLLDAYVWTNMELGEKPVNLRLGKQVVSWGEALFLQDGINSANPANLSVLRLPGAEVKEALLPVGMAYGSFGLSDKLTMEAFYQYEWKKSEPDVAGTFYSTTDALGGEGNYEILVDLAGTPTDNFGLLDKYMAAKEAVNPRDVPVGGKTLINYRLADDKAKNSGQYGLAFRWFAEQLNSTEFGFYFMNYHSRKPVARVIAGQADGALQEGVACEAYKATTAAASCPTSADLSSPIVQGMNALSYIDSARYQLFYPEDIKMYGLSFNTTVGETSYAGELAYRPEMPLLAEFGDNIIAVDALAAGTLGNDPNATFQFGQLGNVKAGQKVEDMVKLPVTNIALVSTHNFGQQLGSDRFIGILELGLSHVGKMDNSLLYASDGSIGLVTEGSTKNGEYRGITAFGTQCATSDRNSTTCHPLLAEGSKADYMTSNSYGYRLVLNATYNDVFAGVNVTPMLRFSHDVKGNSYFSGNFIQDRKSATFSTEFDYMNSFQTEIAYTTFWGADGNNLLSDRDNVALTVRYTF